jgi:hypothetical protein
MSSYPPCEYYAHVPRCMRGRAVRCVVPAMWWDGCAAYTSWHTALLCGALGAFAGGMTGIAITFGVVRTRQRAAAARAANNAVSFVAMSCGFCSHAYTANKLEYVAQEARRAAHQVAEWAQAAADARPAAPAAAQAPGG